MDPFARTKVQVNSLAGGIVVSWEIKRTFNEAGPYQFTVQFGRSASVDDWSDVNTTPVVDVVGAVITDPHRRTWAQHPLIYYRVKLVTAVGTHYSAAQQAVGLLNRYDWLLLRKMAHEEFLCLHKKFGGVKGVYLKRRTFGTVCPGRPHPDPLKPDIRIPTLDYDLNVPVDAQCPLCYGTGILCGFYDPLEMYFVLTQKTLNRDRHEERGTIEDVVISARALAWPIFERGDVFIQLDTDTRYYIHKASFVAEMRGLPLFQEAELRVAPTTDIIQSLLRDSSPCPPAAESYYGGYAYV